MKRIIIALLLISLSTPGFCQNISMEQLVNIANKPTKRLLEYLSSHGWDLIGHQTNPITDNHYYYKFAYNKHQNNNAAVAFIIIRSDTLTKKRTLQLHLFNIDAFNSYKKQVVSIGFKRDDSSLADFVFSSAYINDPNYLERDDNLCSIYHRKDVSVQLCTEVQTVHNNPTAVYVIRLRKS